LYLVSTAPAQKGDAKMSKNKKKKLKKKEKQNLLKVIFLVFKISDLNKY
jgi:hypothetical protein